jgi:Fic family protein
MGRLLIALLLVAWEVFPQPLPYVSAYFEGNRTAYYDGLMGVSQRGEWEFWLLFFLASVALQATAARTRAERLRGLREDYRGRLAAKRAPGLLAALDALLGQPVLTISDLAVGTGLTYQTARRHLQELERAGFVEEITGRRRSRLYAAREVIRIVEEPLTSPERGRLS